jgi:long-chain acyl-CoA synthetase
MEIDLELYRQEVRISTQPRIRLSVIDVAPDYPQHTLVFLHGFAGRATQWQYQLKNFSDNNRVIAIDLRGHGRSDKPRSGYSMAQILSDLMAVLDSLGVNEPFVLVGHSFGGAIAAEFVAAHPERVSHLVLIAATGGYRLNLLYRFLLGLPYPVLALFAPFTRKWLGATPQTLKAFYEQDLSSWNGWTLFQRLQVPTLVIHGHTDIVFQQPLFEETARAIPGAEEMDVGASGHMVMLERREAVNRAIDRFIQPEKHAFSQSEIPSAEARRLALLKERPWLPYYDVGVPYTIAIPRIPLHFLLRSAARRFPSNVALIFEGKSISFLQLNQEANRFANFLRSLGIQPGERILLFLPNLPQMVIAFYGALKAGAVAVFTLPTTQPDELVRQIHDSGAVMLVTLTQFDTLIQKIKAQLGSEGGSPLRHVVFTSPADYLPLVKRLLLNSSRKPPQARSMDASLGPNGHLFRDAIRKQSKDAPDVDVSPGDMAVIAYTGGTTDRPKGVMLSHRNLIANALQTRHWIPDAREGKERFLCALPFSHSYGLTATLNVPVALGAAMILKPQFEVADILHVIKKQRPTIFPGVPQMYVGLKDFPGVRRFGISSIKACISGSAPLPVEVQEAFEKLTRGRLVEGYGLTEASPVTHANPLYSLRKVGSIGIPLPSTQARVVDLKRDREEVSVGQIGELALRGPQVMLGYWGDLHATHQVLSSDGWLLTGDIAQVDGDGYFRIIARKADMWYPNKRGQPAFPRDVEEVLFEVPQVKEAAVVAIAGQPVAFIIARQDRPTSEALVAYCRRRLPPELVPRLVIFVDDFPRTFIGKVLRRELARYFRESERYGRLEDE